MNVLPCELRERADGLIAMGEASQESLNNRLMVAAAERIEELESENDRLAAKCDLFLARLRVAVGVLDEITAEHGELRLPVGTEDICRLKCALANAWAQE